VCVRERKRERESVCERARARHGSERESVSEIEKERHGSERGHLVAFDGFIELSAVFVSCS
jgi:hypothetical protein